MPNNIAITISADVADLTAKRAILSAELKAAQRDLNDFAKTARTTGVTNELRAGMLSSAEAVAKAKAQVSQLNTEMKRLTANGEEKSILNVFDRSRLAVIQEAGAKIPIFGSALADIGPAGIAAGAGVLAFAAAVRQVAKTADWAEDLERTSQALGVSTKALQEFDFVAQATGIPVASMRSSLQGLAETIGKVQDSFVRGKQGEQVKLFELVFGESDPEKAKADLREMGGSIDAILPKILDLSAKLTPTGRAGLAEALRMDPQVLSSLTEARGDLADLTKTAHDMGLVFDESVIKSAAKSAQQMHVAGAVIQGELRQAFINLTPAAGAGALAIEHLSKDLAETIRGATVAAGAVKDFIGDVDAAIKPLGDLDSFLGKATGGFGAFAKQVYFAINPLASFLGLLKQVGAAQIKGPSAADFGDIFNRAPKVDPKLEALIEQIGKTGGGRKGGRGGANKAANDARQMADSDAQTELAIQKAALEDQKAAVEESYRDQIGSAQAKHDQLVALAQQEAADEVAAQQAKINAAGKDVVQAHEAANQILVINADLKAKIDALDRQLTEDKRREDEKRAAQAREAAQVQIEIDRQTLATNQQIRAEQTRTAESQITERGKGAGLFGEIEAAQQIAALHKQQDEERLSEDAAMHAQEDRMLQDDIDKAKAAGGQMSDAYIKAVQAKEKADADFYNKHRLAEAQMVAQEQQDAQRIQQSWHSIVDPMVTTTGNNIKGLIEGTETWGQALKNIGEEALSLVIDAIERMVEQWIVNLIIGKAATTTTAVGQVASYAAVAGAAGTASMAGAPFPIDLRAPAFGAAMSQTALAYGALASLDVGTNVVPRDMPAMIHAGERVMPAADNRAIIAAVEGRSFGAPGNGRGGDFHGDFSTTIHGGGGVDVVRELERSQARFAKLLKGMHRNGHFAFAR